MMLKLIRFLRGYVDFRVCGKFPERFMNITARYGINIWNAVPVEHGISASMYICDYRKIRVVARKSKVRASIEKKHGMSFVLQRYRFRKGLIAGAAVSIIVLLILSNFIWSVKIVGAKNISNTYLCNVLAENGISTGAYKNGIDVESIERSVLLEVGEIGWMSINIVGNVATVEIKEKAAKPKIDKDTSPCNIKAKCDGVITDIKASSGKTEVLKGSGVAKGDLLVSGITETKLGDIKYVHANAEVFADVREVRRVNIKKNYSYYSIKENKTKRNRLKFLWTELPCSLSFDSYEKSLYSTSSQNLLINDVVLPVRIITQTTFEAGMESVKPDRAQAEKAFLNDTLLFEVFEKQKSRTISRNSAIKEKNNDFECVTTYIFNENIAQSVEFNVTE